MPDVVRVDVRTAVGPCQVRIAAPAAVSVASGLPTVFEVEAVTIHCLTP
jgi:hypothetical protein